MNTELRESICLNGNWKIEIDGDNELHDVRVPGSFAGQYKLWGKEHWNTWDYPTEWYEKAAVYHKDLNIPDDYSGKRIIIRFNGVRHKVCVNVNGKEVGNWSDSYVPFSFDITELVKPGINTLAVAIAEDTTCGLFEDYNTNRRGIYRDVFLELVPEVRIANDAFLKTLLSEKKLAYAFELRNDSNNERNVKINFNISDPDGNIVKSWQDSDVYTLEKGTVKGVEISEPWEDPHLWSIDDPYLYHIHSEIIDAESGYTLDHHKLRFGFREISWENAKLFLNGEELYLRGNGNHPMGDLEGGKEFAEAMIKHLKAYGVQIMRMHDLARHQEMYEAGDELGFLFIAEAAHHFRLPTEDVGCAHMERFVKYLWNHPSVIMWSVSNELHWRKFEEPAYLIELCNQLDSTRPAFASDFTPWSLHGDVVAHHYSPETIWSDWKEYGWDKAMIWDELGGVWQHDRNLDTGSSGYEMYGQDVAVGIYRDGKEILNNLKAFTDGKMVDGELRRVNCYMPWEFGYNFYRFQPFNNMQKMKLNYDCVEGTKGIKIDSVMPGASTTNIWDPTLPEYQPNPALYCFKDYLECVRFPDDIKERTFFAGSELTCSGRMFYETHTHCDTVEFLVETLDGEILSKRSRKLQVRPGAYIESFDSSWQLPDVKKMTAARLVRQFILNEESIYRQTRDIKIFPRYDLKKILSNDVAVVGESLQAFFGTKGVAFENATIVVAEETEELTEKVKAGTRVLKMSSQQNSELSPQEALIKMDSTLGEPGKEFTYQMPTPIPLDNEGWFKIKNFQTTKESGIKFPDKLWWEERELWKRSPESYKPHFQIVLKGEKGEKLVSSQNTPLILSRVQQAPQYSEEKFLLSDFEWCQALESEGHIREGKPAELADIQAVSEIILVQVKPCGDKVKGRLLDMKLFGHTRPEAIFPTNGAAAKMLDGFDDAVFATWRGVSTLESLSIPKDRVSRRFLFGNKHGRGSSMHEWYLGEGMVLETSLNIISSFKEEPAAGEILMRCINRLREFKAAAVSVPTALIGDEDLLSFYRELGVDCLLMEEPVSLVKYPLVIAAASSVDDAARLKEWHSKIEEAAAAGTKILFTPVTENTIEVVQSLTGREELSLTEAFFNKNTYCIKAPISWARKGSPEVQVNYFDGVQAPYPFEPNVSPLISGIANIDLNWNGKEMFKNGIELKGMDPVSASPDYNILVSSWHINSEPGKSIFGEMLNGVRDLRQNTWFINRDPVVFQVNSAKGSFVFNQLLIQNGAEQAARIMKQLLTNLGASMSGTIAPGNSDAYDLSLLDKQVELFKLYSNQIEPGVRKYYGVPKPMPEYLKETKINKDDAEELPLLGFIGDELSVQLAHTLGEKLSDVLQASEPVVISKVSSALSALKEKANGIQWDRAVLSVGNLSITNEGLSAEEFASELKTLYQELKPKVQQLFWLPLAPVPKSDTERNKMVEAYNNAAEKVFANDEVYMVPFVYDNAEQVLSEFFREGAKGFNGDEVNALVEALAEAVRSFGAM